MITYISGQDFYAAGNRTGNEVCNSSGRTEEGTGTIGWSLRIANNENSKNANKRREWMNLGGGGGGGVWSRSSWNNWTNIRQWWKKGERVFNGQRGDINVDLLPQLVIYCLNNETCNINIIVIVIIISYFQRGPQNTQPTHTSHTPYTSYTLAETW